LDFRDADRNLLECAPRDWGTGVVVHAKEQRILSQGYYKNSVEHKYSYNAVQYKIPAYGWSSTKEHVGIWFINPTIEFLSGGASKQELVCHYHDNANPDPVILDYWRGTHYGGGASCNMAAGEEWSKVIGPISYTATPWAILKRPQARSRYARNHRGQPHRSAGGQTKPRLYGRTKQARRIKKKPRGRTIGSTASTIRIKTSAAQSPGKSCSSIRKQLRRSCRT
jgi:rhamnogalacturonan endolyase